MMFIRRLLSMLDEASTLSNTEEEPAANALSCLLKMGGEMVEISPLRIFLFLTLSSTS